MKKNKGFIPLLIILAVIALGTIGGVFYFKNKNTKQTPKELPVQNLETQPISPAESIKNATTPKTDFCTSDKGKIMTYKEALAIAEKSSCAKVAKFTNHPDSIGCNMNGGGLIDVEMAPIGNPGCGFACRISIDTGKPEEGWMCTGLIPSSEEDLKNIPNVEDFPIDQIPCIPGPGVQC